LSSASKVLGNHSICRLPPGTGSVFHSASTHGVNMRDKSQILACLTHPGIIAVVRAQHAGQVLPLAEALIAGGVVAIEITMTTPNAMDAIREARRHIGPRGLIGVGTVLDVPTGRAALEAGAEFMVSPVLRPELVAVAHAADRPVMIGAFTPTEAQLAHEAGADFIKIFPADGLGPGYIKALRAPLPHLRIVPTGGVDLETAAGFLEAGCVALGVGSALVSSQILREANWPELTRRAKAFVQVVRGATEAVAR
jgi:2-dehydro-3-deoxyphosphogluconate aldolase / (4S)-4-hydroxy-2-oxoglutarate aldolase